MTAKGLNTPIEQELRGIEFYLMDRQSTTNYLSVGTWENYQGLTKDQVKQLIECLTKYYDLMI